MYLAEHYLKDSFIIIFRWHYKCPLDKFWKTDEEDMLIVKTLFFLLKFFFWRVYIQLILRCWETTENNGHILKALLWKTNAEYHV